MVLSFWNLLDLCAFMPPLIELVLVRGAKLPFQLGRFDFRWFKILRHGRDLKTDTDRCQHGCCHCQSQQELAAWHQESSPILPASQPETTHVQQRNHWPDGQVTMASGCSVVAPLLSEHAQASLAAQIAISKCIQTLEGCGDAR